MTQDQLARSARVTRKTVIRAEQGHPVSAETLMALSSVLGLDSSDLATLRSGRPEPRDAPEASDLLAMVLRGDEDEERRLTLALLAEESFELVPGATSMAVVDLGLWERRTVGRLSPRGSLPAGAGIREACSNLLRWHLRLFPFQTMAAFVAPPFLFLGLYATAHNGHAWAVGTFDLALSYFPSPWSASGVMAVGVACLSALATWTVCTIWVIDRGTRVEATVEAGMTAARGIEILRSRDYVIGRDGLNVVSLHDDGVETVLVPPTATTSFEVQGHDGLVSLKFQMAAGREVPEFGWWTLETLGFDCKEMALPCLRTGPTFLDGLSAYHRIVRPKGVGPVRTGARATGLAIA